MEYTVTLESKHKKIDMHYYAPIKLKAKLNCAEDLMTYFVHNEYTNEKQYFDKYSLALAYFDNI